jgi:2-amino-4-hydroxy-6-hydroxymethyldihydropteridine diphosphokinase
MWRWRSSGRVAEVLLGFGGNLGDPTAAIETALQRLKAEGVRITACSPFYSTPAWGKTDQPDFVNLCAAGETALMPRALLEAIQRIEAELGRERRERWGPRVIDIDILAYDDRVIDEPGLTIPHPHLTERPFVLVPLLDIAPDWIIAGRSVREWAAEVDGNRVGRINP